MFKGVTINGKKLARVRDERLLTQEDLAKELGLTKGNISRIEGLSRTGVQVKNFRKLAEVLKVSPDELRGMIGVDALPRVTFALTVADYGRLKAHAAAQGQSPADAALALVLKGLPPAKLRTDDEPDVIILERDQNGGR